MNVRSIQYLLQMVFTLKSTFDLIYTSYSESNRFSKYSLYLAQKDLGLLSIIRFIILVAPSVYEYCLNNSF